MNLIMAKLLKKKLNEENRKFNVPKFLGEKRKKKRQVQCLYPKLEDSF